MKMYIKMKKIIIALALLLCFSAVAAAQIQASHAIEPGMKYREYKNYYDYHLYEHQKGDPYSRFWTGAASFVIPGLGQIFEGEWVRGLLFFAGNAALGTAYRSSFNVEYDSSGNVIASSPKSFLTYVYFFGYLGVDIWAMMDAIHVAKIKNMYYQDLKAMRSSLDVDLEPYFAYTPSSDGMKPVTGLSLKLNF